MIGGILLVMSFLFLGWFDFVVFLCLGVVGIISLVSVGVGFSFGGLFFLDGFGFFLGFMTLVLFFVCSFGRMVDKWGGEQYHGYVWMLRFVFVSSFLCFCFVRFVLFYFGFEFIFLVMYFFLLA